MDSITHIALGACIGEIVLGKKLGKKALFWGALSQSLPDIDSIGFLFYPADKALLIHRGITHSIFFAIIIGILLAWIVKKVHPKPLIAFSSLLVFFCFQLLLHDLIDTCNSYGTGLLEPFDHRRFAINLLYVADPFFSASLMVASLVLLVKSRLYRHRERWAGIAIFISFIYVCIAGINKQYINRRSEASLKAKGITPASYFSTPAPFSCILWYIVADAGSGYYMGYSSIWDDTKQPVEFEFHPKNYSLLNKPVNREVLRNLTVFADSCYTASQSGNSIYLNIPRFEQLQGWRIPNAAFSFSYPLYGGKDLATLLQRGRLKGWNTNTLWAYVKRVTGTKPEAKQNPVK